MIVAISSYENVFVKDSFELFLFMRLRRECMNYIVRTLDRNGKLRKERFMFHSVRILDKNGLLKKVIKEKMLSQKYWELILNKKDNKRKAKRVFNPTCSSNSDLS